jgi:hypothetical protein
MAISANEFDERARESMAALRRTAATLPMYTRAIIECNTDLHANQPVRDRQELIHRLAADVCRDLPVISCSLPVRTSSRREYAHRQSVLRHIGHQATIPGSNFDYICTQLAERGFVGSFEYPNPDKTIARFRYSRSITTDRVLSSTTQRQQRRHVESVDPHHNSVRTDKYILNHYTVETAEVLRTRQHVIVSPQLHPVDAPIEQPAHVTKLIRSFRPPYTAGLVLVTGTLLDFSEHDEEIQRRQHTVRRDIVLKGRASVELTELGRLREQQRHRERRNAHRHVDPCLIFGRWCLVGWLPESYDVSRFLDY